MSDPHTSIDHQMTVRADMSITKEDLVAIRVADAEKALHMEKLQLIDRRRAAETALKKCESLQPTLNEEVAAATLAGVFDAALSALNAVRSASRKEPFCVHSCVRRDEKTGKLYAVGTICGVSDVEVVKNVSAANVKRLLALEAEVKVHQKELEDCENGMLDVKRRIMDIPMLERQAKAAVARAVMNGSDVGTDLMNIVNRTSLPGLPAPKG